VLVEVKVPVLAESVAEATLLSWHKNPGDAVKRGDSLIEIETDKVTLEIAAMNNGVLAKIVRGDGETVKSNEVIAIIDTASSETKSPASLKDSNKTPQQQTLPVGDLPAQQPRMSPVVRGLIEEHKLDALIIPATGEGNRLTREDVLRHLDVRNVVDRNPPAPKLQPATDPLLAQGPQVLLAPAGVEPANVQEASVPGIESNRGKIVTAASATPAGATSQDMGASSMTAIKASSDQANTPSSTTTAQAAPMQQNRPEQRVAMTRLRQRTAERLLTAQRENAILTTFNEINMHAVMELRNRHREEFERQHGVKLGFMSFFTHAVTESLKRFPLINASVDGTHIIYHGYFDIGVAVSTDRGLVVPIIRDADLLSLAAIERKIREFSEKAKTARLSLDDLSGGTFTITNGGVFGSMLSTPIINPPQSAILGMHAIQNRPIADHGEIVIRPVMYVALSYDHRIIDGSVAVSFLVHVKQLIEDPARLLLQI